MPAKLELYYKPTCPFCHKVLAYMDEHDIEMPMYNIDASPERRAELIEIGGKAQVPCLMIDGNALYESDDIIAYLQNHLI